MGQITHEQYHRSVSLGQTDDLMMKIFTFNTKDEADECEQEFIHRQYCQKQYEIQIKTIEMIQLTHENLWKVALGIEYPQQSLRSIIIDHKKTRKSFTIEQIFQILELTIEFIRVFGNKTCQHTDIYAYLFKNDHKIKICHPRLLYQSCNRRACTKSMPKQFILRQILQIFFLEKVVELNQWRILRRIHQIYNNSLLDNLFGNIIRPQKSLNQILSEYQQMKQQLREIQVSSATYNSFEYSTNYQQQHPKTPQFISPFAFPKIESSPEQTPTKESGLHRYKQQISESLIKEDSNQSQQQLRESTLSYEQYQQSNQNIRYSRRQPQIRIESSSQGESGSEKIQITPEEYFIDSRFIPEKQEEPTNWEFESIQFQKATIEQEQGTFKGYLKNGLRYGRGKFQYKDGTYYDGDWLNNKKHGYGCIYDSNNVLCYSGSWKDDYQDGEGEYINNNFNLIEGPYDYEDLSKAIELNLCRSYNGSFRNGQIDGKGTLVLSNGETFAGNWRQGLAEGRGEFTTLSGNIIKGVWSQGILESEFDRQSSQRSISQDSEK